MTTLVPPYIKLKVLASVDMAEGFSIKQRIINTSERIFVDENTGKNYKFTWRTISTWFYRYKIDGTTSMINKNRSDKGKPRKIQLEELASAISEVIETLPKKKKRYSLKMVLYRQLIQQGYFRSSQLAKSTFYHLVRENNLLDDSSNKKIRQTFMMPYANDMWQGDTLYGPNVKDAKGASVKTYLITLIDDASRVVTHAEFYYADNTINLLDTFKKALNKRGKPTILYFDNGSNYRSKEISSACVRLGIKICHAPVRDGAAKGKVEKFNQTVEQQFLSLKRDTSSLKALNKEFHDWLENDYNISYHNTIQMQPVQRFNIDYKKIQYITNMEYFEEVFYIEENRTASKTNVISFNGNLFECPEELSQRTVQVRYDRNDRSFCVVYYKGRRVGKATPLNPIVNAELRKPKLGNNNDQRKES